MSRARGKQQNTNKHPVKYKTSGIIEMKQDRIIIPPKMRNEMLTRIHARVTWAWKDANDEQETSFFGQE